jgi:hypothetical protein
MSGLLDAVNKIRGGYKAQKRMKSPEHTAKRKKQGYMQEWGDPDDPNQDFTGQYGPNGEEIWSGGNVASTRIQSETISRSGQGDLTEEDAKDLGVDPRRMGIGEFDAYEDFTGELDDVGVSAFRGGNIDKDTFRQNISATNERGDVTKSSRGYFENRMNPYGQGQITSSQLGRGKSATNYYDDDEVTMTSGRKFGFIPWGSYEEKQ